MGGEDPYGDDYEPSLDGGPDVGSGREFGADLFKLYLAGRKYLPDTANVYSAAASGAQSAGVEANGVAQYHPTLRRMDAILKDLHQAFYRTTTSVHATGEALVAIADDYVRTDEAARTEFLEYYDDAHTLEPDENSPPPLADDQLPEPYEPPPHPDDYGNPPPAYNPMYPPGVGPNAPEGDAG